MSDLMAWLEPRRRALQTSLDAMFADAWPPSFTAPLRYPLQTGGKRIRPALCLAAHEAITGSDTFAPALPAALALELVHTYSLVHDDLPDMDDDVERRGRPTVHVAFDPATAILAGDALLTHAFTVLARAPWPAGVRVAVVDLLADAAGYRGMVGGQAADIGLGGPHTDLDGALRVHAGKTGALLRASVLAGGLVARASADQLAALDTAGAALGLAFQLVDDIFDHDEDDGPNVSQVLGRDATRERARELAARATDALGALPRPAALLALGRLVVERDH